MGASQNPRAPPSLQIPDPPLLVTPFPNIQADSTCSKEACMMLQEANTWAASRRSQNQRICKSGGCKLPGRKRRRKTDCSLLTLTTKLKATSICRRGYNNNTLYGDPRQAKHGHLQDNSYGVVSAVSQPAGTRPQEEKIRLIQTGEKLIRDDINRYKIYKQSMTCTPHGYTDFSPHSQFAPFFSETFRPQRKLRKDVSPPPHK